jgi:four helix bundle protein
MTLNYKLVAGCSLLVAGSYKKCILEVIISLQKSRAKSLNMSNYKDLEIYQIAFELARKVHLASLKLPQFELYEQGSQIRRSSKSIKDQIAEGYGRKRYKPEFVKFLTYAQSSCDETISQLEMLIQLYTNFPDFLELLPEYEILGRKINNFIQYVEASWKT